MFYANRIRFISSCLCIGMIMINSCLTKDIERTEKMSNSSHKIAEQAPFPQEPKRPFLYHEEEVSYQNKTASVTLSGTLTMPDKSGCFAAVILIAGYGPNDRDYSLMGHKRFLVLADHLTRSGLAVLRFDKRGVGKSTGDYVSATSRDFADDVVAGIEYLKTRKEIDSTKIGLIGHSEGGMISSMIAAESTDVAFVILMAGIVQADIDGLVIQTAKQMKADGASQELLDQDNKLRTQMLTIVNQSSSEESKAKLEKILQVYWNNLPEHLKLESEKIPFAITQAKIEGMVNVYNSPWYRYFIGCKPERFIAQIKVPMLALYGDHDWITSSQPSISIITETLKAAESSDVTTVEFPNLNHSLQTCKTGALAEYGTIEETIAPVVLKAMSDWILNKRGKTYSVNLKLDSTAKTNFVSVTNLSGKFLANDKSGKQVVLEWINTDMASLEYEKVMKSVWDIACPTYTKVEVDFLRVHPEVVGKEDYFKPFEPLFKDGIQNVNWSLVEEKMQEILKPVFVFDVSAFDEDLKNKFSSAEHFFVSVRNEKAGGLLGFASFLIIPEYAAGDVKCIALAVKPEEQNRGLGKLLMSSIYRIISDLKRIFLCTRTTNIIAQKAYYNWGFVKYWTNDGVTQVFEEHDYTFDLNHWIFMEYKLEQSDKLQKVAATLIDLSSGK